MMIKIIIFLALADAAVGTAAILSGMNRTGLIVGAFNLMITIVAAIRGLSR